jgi:uncharacterized protein involved in exopolysaccharide biosynthesis
MQDSLNSNSDDEIDLREFFITLWAYKLLIVCICATGVILAGYYALNMDKEYSSTAIFKLDKTGSSAALGSQDNFLSSLAGLNPSLSNSFSPKDQIYGRIFIESINDKLNFKTDPYFNTYNPNYVDPLWKSIIKRAIKWQESSRNIQEIIWQGIVSTYSKNVTLETTLDGSFKITVTHKNPKRAAEIANTIMDTIIETSKSKKNTNLDLQLSYLSNSLAKSLSDLEISQSNLKKFALENSALPLESFAAGSLQVETFREQLNRTSELLDAVTALSLMLENKTTDQDNYLTLRQEFPIVDQVEFRRVLGQNEIISSWNWPDASSVNAVLDTLLEREKRLISQIDASIIDAKRFGLALETYDKLQREAKIAEATYTVLIEQVKSQSVVAGYRPDNTEIYEFATASINPSAPRRNVLLALGAVSGLLLGAALSLIISFCRGVYYSKNSLKNGAQAHFSANIKSLIPLRNRSLDEVNTMLMKNPNSVLRDIAVEIHKNEIEHIVITSSRAKLTGNNVARMLACYMNSKIIKVALIDFSSKSKKLDIDGERFCADSFVVSESVGHISILRPDNDFGAMELLSHKNFWGNIQSLKSTFDLVIISADNNDVISLLSALEGQKAFHITIARTKNTKSSKLIHMRSLLPIQGLLYD